MTNDKPAESARVVEPRRGVSPDAVRRALEGVLAHREFQATEKLRNFLSFVVEETLDGRADQLKGYTIATQVFGRGPDFDPARDPVVRIQAGRLRRALERYYLVTGACDEVRIDIPKGCYVPRFRRRPPAGSDRAPAAAPRRGAGSGTDDPPSVAVLPLEDLTGRDDRLFFTIGLAEELAIELDRVEGLVVVPCRRAARAEGEDPDPREPGASARFVLAGTFRTDGTKAKVSLGLVDTASDEQVWAGGFRHDLAAGGLIETQEAIARAAAAAVAGVIDGLRGAAADAGRA